jgi:hypothetical protein
MILRSAAIFRHRAYARGGAGEMMQAGTAIVTLLDLPKFICGALFRKDRLEK